MSRPLPHPHAVLGFRKDGQPIHPILGASDAPSNDPPQVRTFTQDEVTRLLAREKQQGGRSAAKELTGFVQAQKAAEAAQLTEVERREQAAAERAKAADLREAAATARERAADRRRTLFGLGALGDDLKDAESLLRAAVPDDADEAKLTEAAEALKKRRPNLFDGQEESSRLRRAGLRSLAPVSADVWLGWLFWFRLFWLAGGAFIRYMCRLG